MWILFTLLASLMQSLRSAAQKQLSREVPVLGCTLARFFYATPMAGIYLFLYYQFSPNLKIPEFTGKFWLFIFLGAVVQISGNNFLVRLFQLKNYALGVGLAKIEAIFSAILGVLFFNTRLNFLGILGVIIGSVAIFLLTGISKNQKFSWKVLFYGVLCGLGFALTGLFAREAALSLADIPRLAAAAWVLFVIISFEALCLFCYLLLKQRAVLKQLFQHNKLHLATSLTSCIGSLGWFSAFSLKAVPYVKTLGQIEVVFMLLISALIFKERLRKLDYIGLFLIVISSILVILPS